MSILIDFLCQSNILLDDEGKALLSDFGLSNVVVGARGPLYITSSIGGSVRWAAPENFSISEGDRVSTVTTHGDIYSYGSVMLQVRALNTTWTILLR
jgi:serine/threonine protein kinase